LQLLNLTELRTRLAQAEPDAARPDSSFVPIAGDDTADITHSPLKPAAVLVPLLRGDTPGVLLTKRTAHLSSHGGQVSFPGGRIDPDDASPEAAALREAEEEIGLRPGQVEIVGRLRDYITGTGYHITPVIGLLPDGIGLESLGLRLSSDEVDLVFALPLAVLLDPAAPRRKRAEWHGRWREFWVWPHADHYIWGATAGILMNLAAKLRSG
jgi:8-oxo-dGTP pyrophosphatase MutT (NUDIX family)